MQMTSTASETVHATKLSRKGKKAIVAGSIGNAVEFVDWAVYSTFSSIFAHHFFPAGTTSPLCCRRSPSSPWASSCVPSAPR